MRGARASPRTSRRIHIRDQDLSDDAGMEHLLEQIRDEIGGACERVLTCEPDYMVMGMSAETFWDGVEGNRAVRRSRSTTSPASRSPPAPRPASGRCSSTARAGSAWSRRTSRSATRTSSSSSPSSASRSAAIKGLKCPTAVVDRPRHRGRAARRDPRGRRARRRRDRPVRHQPVAWSTLADEAERWLGKPVIAINAATWWMALRDNGIDDQVHGFGSLLREH